MLNKTHTLESEIEPKPSVRKALEVETASEDLLDEILYDIDNQLEFEINRIRKSGVSSMIQWAYVVTVGTGKTYALTRAAAKAVQKGWRVAIRAPTTKHARELKAEINKISAGAAEVWLGREQKNPDKPAEKMCPRAAEVVAAQLVGGDPEDVCGSKKRGYCNFHPRSHHDGCGYKEQDLRHKQVVIFAGDSILELVPRKPMRQKGRKHGLEFDLVLLDEFDPQGFVQSTKENIDLNFAEASNSKLSDNTQIQDILATFLRDIQTQMLSGQRYITPLHYEEPSNDMTFDELLEFSATPSLTCEQGLVHDQPENETKPQTPADKKSSLEKLEGVLETINDAMPTTIGKGQFRKMTAAQIYDINKKQYKIRRSIQGLQKICELMSQAIIRDVTELKHAEFREEYGGISIDYLRKINLQYCFPPVLVFDATLQYDLARCVLTNLEIRTRRHVSDGAGVKRFQLIDTSLSYSTLKSSDKWPARLGLWGELCHIMFGLTGLLLPKFLRHDIEHKLQGDITIGHFGDLKGSNEFKHVGALIVASRPAVNPRKAERTAAILSWENIQALEEQYAWYPREEAPIHYRQNTAYSWPVSQEKHPDERVEAVRQSITEASIEQAVGRGRSTRRTEDEPLTEYILTSVPTNRPVDGVFSVAQLKAATSWIGVLLHVGLWIPLGTKGAGDLLHKFALALKSQRPDTLYSNLIGLPAFESADSASSWRKKQIQDNFEISQLASAVDDALKAKSDSVELLCSPFPLTAFQPIRAKVRGARYFAQAYVRVAPGQTAKEALLAILGPFAEDVEIEA